MFGCFCKYNPFPLKSIKFNTIIDISIALVFFSALLFGEDVNTLIYFKLCVLFCVLNILIYYLTNKVITLKIDNFIKLFFLFVSFCFISSVWAYDFELSWSKSFSLLQNFMIIFFMYDYLRYNNKTKFIINVLALSGFLYSIYVFTYYGFFNYLSLFMLGESRLGSDITNVNSIGLNCFFSNIIIVWKIVYKKNYFFLIPFIFCSIIALGTGSKKIVLGCFIAFIFLLFFKTKIKTFITYAVVFSLIISFLFPLLYNLPFLHKLISRTEAFFYAFSNYGKTDFSTQERLNMIKIGWAEFKANPILGIGVNNSHYVLGRIYNGWDTYFHNNFTELFASLGIFGGTLYYLFFLYPVIILLKRKYKLCDEYVLVLILILVRLFLHIAMVDYYAKSTFFYILLGYLILKDKVIFDEYQNKLIEYSKNEGNDYENCSKE